MDGFESGRVLGAGYHLNGRGALKRSWRMDFLNNGDLRFKGVFPNINESSLELIQVLAVVRIMSIQSAKGACMVCPQRLIFYCWPTQKDDYRNVLRCIHGI